MRALPDRAGGILSYFTRHKTLANLILVILLSAGVLTFPKMRAQFFPDVVFEAVSVSVKWQGAGAEDVDRAIVQILEPVLLAVDGVDESTATSREGSARIELQFEPGWDMAQAADDVQSAVDAITTLPADAEKPEVRRAMWRDRVTDVVITGPVGVQQLSLFADEMVTRLFAVGVTRSTIRGVAAPETLIEVPMAKLIANDISMEKIAAAIKAEVDADPAGDVTGANARVRTGVEKRTADQIRQIVLRSNPDGSTLRVGDVATVLQRGVDRNESYLVGDEPAISVRIDRSDKGDAIKIQHTVEKVAAELEATLPDGVKVDLIRTRAEAITGRLEILTSNGLSGLVLVLIILFLFLNARTAFWVAAGIPASMLTAVALMYWFGITLNMISLFALIITLGIVVDDAIVVGEHSDFLARQGLPPVDAAETAARRMALPVASSTITTVIAFMALIAIGGRFGDMIADIPFTVSVVLIASLVECFFILPNHMSHALVHVNKDHWYDKPSKWVNRNFDRFCEVAFRPFMDWVVKARYVVMAAAVLALSTQLAMIIRGDVRWQFFNSPEQSSITANIAMANTATRDDTLAMVRELQRATEELRQELIQKHGWDPIDFVLAQIGGNSGRALSGTDGKEDDLLGSIAIELIEADLRLDADGNAYSSFMFIADLQDKVRNHPLAETVSFRSFRGGPGGDALDVQFFGADAQTLKSAAEDLKTAVARYPEVSAVEDDLAYDKEEMVLDLTAQGQALGFTIDELGRVLRSRINGIEAATYPDGPRSATIRVELPKNELTADFLERMQIRTPTGHYVPLADLVSVTRSNGFSTVRRENGLRMVSVTGDISSDDAAREADIKLKLKTEILPKIASDRHVEWRMAGLSEQENTFLADAVTGLILALLGIYLTLAWVFSSWMRPLVVMSIIPFGLVGAVYGHYLHEIPMSMFTVVGLLGMTGIIINDSIVLVTTIDEYAPTRSLAKAIVDGTTNRLRPVMLTTATTVFGLAPLLFEKSQDAQFLKPTVVTLVYGLGFGMILVLLVVPSLIAAQGDIGRAIRSFRTALRFRDMRVRRGLWAISGGIALWLMATVGYALVSGAVWGPVAMIFPVAAKMPVMAGALSAYFIGLLMIAAVFGGGMAWIWWRGRRA